MFKIYCGKLAFRISVFLIALYAYIYKPALLNWVMADGPVDEIYWIYIIWAILMGGMVLDMFPNHRLTMGNKKRLAKLHAPVKNYDKLEMYRYIQRNNVGAMRTLIVWLSFNAIFGILFLKGVITAKELILLSLFFYVCDLICVVIWCPFQQFFMKNKCCVNCRIFNWGRFMMFTPLLFIAHFLTWSLFFTALIVMLKWELTLLHHPERFWENSNKNLQCAHCQDKICKFKKPQFLDLITSVPDEDETDSDNSEK